LSPVETTQPTASTPSVECREAV